MKYKLTNETKQWRRRTLHRIQATEDFGDVKAGDLGGWVEREDNLSQGNNCLVGDNAVICDNAEVRDYAVIRDCARIGGHAVVRDFADICGHAVVRDFADICGHAWIRGHAVIRDYAMLRDHAVICDDAVICGDTVIRGYAVIGSNAYIAKTTDYITIPPIGSHNVGVTFYKTAGDGISVTYGDFEGNIDEFAAKVTEMHGNNKHAQMYKLAIEMAKLQILGDD